tara:strand:+ start:2771 stop:3001 length:231 start_codon:yes stop_codon:yes gene_type:complete
MIKTQTNVYDSSTIVSSSYVYETKELFIGFKHGTYLYKEVDEKDYNEFRDATSQGIALNNIIKGVYKYEKIEEHAE